MAAVTTLPAAFVANTVLTAAEMNNLRGAFRVLQVVQATTVTQVSTTSATYVTTGLSAAITPSSSSSKVLVIVSASIQNQSSVNSSNWTLFRGTVAGTNLATATGFQISFSAANALYSNFSTQFLDSPATTSATTYTAGMKTGLGGTCYSQADNTTSSMILMEISA